VQQNWVSLDEHPTVEILLSVVAELQQRVAELEADMVTMKGQQQTWPAAVEVPADLWKPTRR